MPDDLEDREAAVYRVLDEVRLIGPSAVIEQLGGIAQEVSAGHAATRSGQPGPALDRCDNRRHMGYYLMALARADLTNDRRELRKWGQRR